MNNVIDFINVNRDRYVDELKQYLAIPSISALPGHAADVRRCAEWTARRDDAASACRTSASTRRPATRSSTATGWARPGAPTILFYGHYDVQPVDPLNLWTSPPFEATVRDGEIYARGAADDKGQVFMHFKAIEAHLKQNGRLPVNMKFLIEGEEEVGSANLDDFIRAHKELLKADVVVISRLADVRSRHPVDLLRAARPRLLPDRPARHEDATCTPDRSAARSPTPRWCWRRCWRR